jgi:hypothetical protein
MVRPRRLPTTVCRGLRGRPASYFLSVVIAPHNGAAAVFFVEL